jgi:3-hydroxy-9,10-secoandrosta-1,3,5(10)-triene-9,17-dione monooxygenase reductase component
LSQENPFVTPPLLREPARRFRGRLPAPVTIWTAGAADGRAGLTISSLLVAEGRPSSVLGLVGPTSELWDAINLTSSFVVHICEEGDRRLAERFAGRWPAPGGLFQGLGAIDGEWGPVLPGLANRVYCRLTSTADVGFQHLIIGRIDTVEVADDIRPLVYLQGRYRRLTPRADFDSH